MNLCHVYHKYIPDFLTEAAATPPMERLRDIGMNCGCEYTSFPLFLELQPYSRLEHSLGVALIVWHFTGDRAQALSGLFHDIAAPTFAHAIDFFRGDHLTQESTEDGTAQIIAQSDKIQELLVKYGLTTDDVCDYHKYPIADNNSPLLSADRLEYTLGNLVNYGFSHLAEIEDFYYDLTVGANESGQKELMFRTPSIALAFSEGALKCSNIYVADSDRFAMQALANLLKEAVRDSVVTEQDFYSTERNLIEKLMGNQTYAAKWTRYCSYSEIRAANQPGHSGTWLNVPAKKRYIDPFISGYGRVSQLYPAYAEKIEAFKASSQDYWICGR